MWLKNRKRVAKAESKGAGNWALLSAMGTMTRTWALALKMGATARVGEEGGVQGLHPFSALR